MIWLSARLLRTPFAAAAALVLVVCTWLAITGHDLAGRAQHHPNLYDGLTGTDRFVLDSANVLLAAAPALLGAFWGAPIVSRELETGTYRLAWTQSVTRSRWLAVRLGISVLAVILVVGLLTLAITWWAAPVDDATGTQLTAVGSRVTPIAFAMRGVVPIGYAVFALVLGTFIGMAVRRTVPAMALTLLVYVVTQVAVPFWVRPHLVPPDTDTQIPSANKLAEVIYLESGGIQIATHPDEPRAWILSNQTIDTQGHPASIPAWFATCMPMDAVTSTADPEVCFDRLASDGYRQRLVYHPTGHFWPLQLAELGLYLALSALLSALSFWWLRRRLS